jgi:uncharacterized protein DUF5752
MTHIEPFVFYTEHHLVGLTGKSARNLPELLEHLRSVSGSTIFYHTHGLYLRQNFVKPRFYNEFAGWVHQSLQEHRLAERIGAIDLLSMTSIRELRESIICQIERHFRDTPSAIRDCREGDEFHFCESKSFVVNSGIVARTVPDFFRFVTSVSNASIHFHVFESRLRLERPANDFSIWLSDLGETRLARAIDRLDPYAVSLDQLKAQIGRIGRRTAGRS